MKYRVTADIEYLDGTLAGIVIPAGFTTTDPDIHHAIRRVQWLQRVMRENDFIRAVGTGNKYRVVGGIEYREINPLVYV